MEGLEGEVGPPNLKLPDRRMWELLEDCGHVQIAREKPAIIHPGSGRSGKCWPLPNFLFLAERCAQFGPAAPHFLIGEVEESTWSRDKILQLESASTFTRNPSLLSAAALIASASLFIGNDSGMSHLAAALGTPTIAIFGPTDPAIWKPLGRDVAVFGGGGFPPATEVFEYIQERFISSWR
ncbi:hypothetical protein HYR69_04970 [Candidatus Sumerlaeota bacterium]|nr:hypothetical protein [Candidatus Sumerlaeota bacterium]MBI3737354.1 hypothetical protein [Candidatus Sumerlaeota bacterium]